MPGVRLLLARPAALLALTVSLSGLGVGAAHAQPAAGLTAHQEQVVLGLIDDICGDTWCEGDLAFDFRRFSCDPAARTCTLRLRIAPSTDGPPVWRPRTGTVRGFVRFGQMVRTAPDGGRSLDPRFYAAVSAMIARVEARPLVPGGARGTALVG